MESEKVQLHFSIQGEFITNLAREKCYEENDIAYALNLLTHCLMSDDLPQETILGLAFQILDGTMEIVGTYPGEDYGIRPVPNAMPRLMDHLKSLKTQLDTYKKKEQQAVEKLCCLAETIPSYMKYQVNDAWKEYGYDDSIFPDVAASEPSPLLDDVFDRILNSCADDDYGWLEPDGTYHPVEWAHHQNWARHYLKEQNHSLMLDSMTRGCAPGDLLVEQGWVLLHNPGQGLARPTYNTARGLTKKQKEFLFDYYVKRKKETLANEYFNL